MQRREDCGGKLNQGVLNRVFIRVHGWLDCWHRLKAFNQIKMLILAGFCLVGGVLMGWRTLMHPPPSKAQLTAFEGSVNRVTMVPRSPSPVTYPLLYLADETAGFGYLDWFPEPERISELKPGDRVRLLSDTPNGNRWIWSLEKDGKTVVAYEEVLAAVRSNNSFDPIIAVILALMGSYLVFSLIKSVKSAGSIDLKKGLGRM